MDSPPPPFHALGPAHLTILALTFILPFLLAAVVRRSQVRLFERVIAVSLSLLLVGNYIAYVIFVRKFHEARWYELLPLQLCDWAMIVIIIALVTGRRRWFEVAYFWGIGGTLQALLTPNLPFGWPDLRFISFFVAHSAIVVGIIFMMLVQRYRPYPISILRTILWTELYFLVGFVADNLTGLNYGFLLHKPEAFSLLSFLSDWRPLYLVQFHGLAWIFFSVLYLPFFIYDHFRRAEVPAGGADFSRR